MDEACNIPSWSVGVPVLCDSGRMGPPSASMGMDKWFLATPPALDILQALVEDTEKEIE